MCTTNMPCTHHTSSIPHTSFAVNLKPSHSISRWHATQIIVHASQSQQPLHPHRVPRQLHRQTKDDHKTTDTTHGHRLSSKSERNLIILQVNINGIKNKLLIHNTHTDIITIGDLRKEPARWRSLL